MIIRRERRDRFTIVDNAAVEDPRLSFKALGLLAYLLSRPNGWSANYRQLSTTHTDGTDSTRAGLDELRRCGYLKQRRVRVPETGKFEWECVIHESPVDDPVDNTVDSVENESPCSGFPGLDNPGPGNPSSSKELRSKDGEATPQPPASGGRRERQSNDTPLSKEDRGSDFQRFWDAYPKKTHRFPAEQTWVKMLDELPAIDVLLNAVDVTMNELALAHPGSSGTWVKFAPRPNVWLADRRWRDVESKRIDLSIASASRTCLHCGVKNPGGDTPCMGVEVGILGTADDCIHRP